MEQRTYTDALVWRREDLVLLSPRNQVCEPDEDVSAIVYLDMLPRHTRKGVWGV